MNIVNQMEKQGESGTMHRGPIVIVVASRLEFCPLEHILVRLGGKRQTRGRVYLPGTPPVLLLQAGVGKKRMRRVLRPVLEEVRPAWLVSCGCCGALKPYLRTATLLAPGSVCVRGGERLPLAPLPWPVTSVGAPDAPITGESCVSVQRPAGRREKQNLATFFHDALFVDMETWWMAQMGREWGIPVSALRVVSDRLQHQVPGFGRNAAWYLIRPRQTLCMLSFLLRVRRSMVRLAGWLEKRLKER